MIKVVLFDLDGTLLPMDLDKFMEAYIRSLTEKMVPYGYEPKCIIHGVGQALKATTKNDGAFTNEEVFVNTFVASVGEHVRKDLPVFLEYYKNEFQSVKKVCGYHEMAKRVVDRVKEKGSRVVLATNPVVPAIATQSRIKWAGLMPEDFELYTTYENSNYCKPNPKYYQQVLEKIGVAPEECLMVGNDVTEDMVAQTLGMKVFLLTDCLINKENKDISVYPNGSFGELMDYLEEIL